MDQSLKSKSKLILLVSKNVNTLIQVLRSWYFYAGLFSIIAGAAFNVASQRYLLNSMSEGKTMPMLSDLILDNLPFYNVSLIYDLFYLISVVVAFIYLIHKGYNKLPYFLLLYGIFFIIRSVFIVLTPLGNPPMFSGSGPPFHGFSKYEVGVYPSGHVGSVFLIFLMLKDKWYKYIISFSLVIIIISLLFAHGHYSIDIFSGLFFAYTINSYGEKHLKMFDLGSGNDLYCTNSKKR